MSGDHDRASPGPSKDSSPAPCHGLSDGSTAQEPWEERSIGVGIFVPVVDASRRQYQGGSGRFAMAG